MTPPAAKPATMRLANRSGSVSTSAAARELEASSQKQALKTGGLPKRSPSGPRRSWPRPKGSVKADDRSAAVPAATPKSRAMAVISGSK